MKRQKKSLHVLICPSRRLLKIYFWAKIVSILTSSRPLNTHLQYNTYLPSLTKKLLSCTYLQIDR